MLWWKLEDWFRLCGFEFPSERRESAQTPSRRFRRLWQLGSVRTLQLSEDNIIVVTSKHNGLLCYYPVYYDNKWAWFQFTIGFAEQYKVVKRDVWSKICVNDYVATRNNIVYNCWYYSEKKLLKDKNNSIFCIYYSLKKGIQCSQCKEITSYIGRTFLIN